MSAQFSLFELQEVKPYGKSWSEWSADWWRWAVSMPRDKNPGMGTVTQTAATPAHDDVIFLVGAFDTAGERQLKHDLQVPAGKSVFFPVINCTNALPGMVCYGGGAMKTDDDLKQWAKEESFQKYDILINGEPVQQQMIVSDVFDIEYPEKNVFDHPSGKTRGISIGYWVFLKSLAAGEYDIMTYGSCMLGKIKIDAAYHLTVR